MRDFGFFRVAAALPDVRVADCGYNAQQIVESMRQAAAKGARVVVMPELSISGYSCGDLFGQPTLQRGVEQALAEIVVQSETIPVVAIVGLPVKVGCCLFDAAAVVAEGEIMGIVPKMLLADSGCSNDSRSFISGAQHDIDMVEIAGQIVPFGAELLFEIEGVKFAIEIGEDLWGVIPTSSYKALSGAEVIFSLAALPELVGQREYLTRLVSQQSACTLSAYILSSAGWGESSSDMLYGGAAYIVENGVILSEAKPLSAEQQLIVADVDVELLRNARAAHNGFRRESNDAQAQTIECSVNFLAADKSLLREVDPMPFVPSDESLRAKRCEEIFATQALALAKRLKHTNCRSAVVGISGGLDSTLALLVTVEAFDRLGLDRKGVLGVTMPGFGTTDRTYNNAVTLIKELGITLREISIAEACRQHFKDIGLSDDDRSVAYENSQARERTQILMDLSNIVGGMVIGTGDMSELALGWATYNGDQMSMYGVNGSVPKTLVRHMVEWAAGQQTNEAVRAALLDVVATPVSPELLPADEQGNIAQKTEDLVGPYQLHDFFLYNFLRRGFSPAKIYFLAQRAFEGEYDKATILKWLKTFYRRFFSQQFKRSALPDGVKVGSVSLSSRGDWRMPSDASAALWLDECEALD